MKPRSPMAVLFTAVLVDMMGFGIVIPVLPFYALELGATPLQVTLLIASFSAMQMAATPLWGRVSDRRGRRPLLVAGLFASAVSYLIFGLAGSLWLLLLSRMAAGAAGGTISVAHAYVADTTSPEQRAAGMGQIGAAAGLGVMLGPAIGGFFSRWGLGAPGFVAAALCLLNALAALVLLPESRQRGAASPGGSEGARRTSPEGGWRGWLRIMSGYPLPRLLGVYFLGISAFTVITAVLALYFEHRFGLTAQEMGLLFTLSGATTVLVRGALLGPLVRRLGEPATIRLGVTGVMLAALLVPLIPSVWWVVLVVPLYAFGAGTLFPSLTTLVSLASDPEAQGTVLGGSQLVGGLGRVSAPIWGGWLFQSVGAASPYFIAALSAGLALLLAHRIPPARLPVPAATSPAPTAPVPGSAGAAVSESAARTGVPGR